MKNIFAYCIVVLFVACDSSQKKSVDTTSEKKESKEITTEAKSNDSKDDISLSQHGDYSTLFKLQKGDCSFVNAKDIATALDLPEGNIDEVIKYNRCSYEITLADNSKWIVSLQWHPFSKDDITREIENYKEEGSPLTAILSDTKDTYLCIHPFNRFLMIFNNNYDGTIQIQYCETECKKLSKEQQEARKQLAITLSNYLLQKHKK